MSGTPNKVQFGLKNVHYALLTETAGSAPSWDTPVAVPGAVSLELSNESAANNFYADNRPYFRTSANNGYTGTLEMAKIPDEMLEDVFGFGVVATDNVVYEDANAEPLPFALLFQIDGDQNDDYYVLYKVYGSRPNIAGNTTDENGKTPVTQTIDIVCFPLVDESTNGYLDGKVYAKTNEDTTTTVKSGWFSAVYDDFTA